MLMTERIEQLGGVARVQVLRRAGYSEALIRAGIRSGAISSIRRGWVCSPTAPDAVVCAVEHGGRLGCVSAAHHIGLWTLPHSGVHIAVPKHAGRAHRSPGIAMHWTSTTWSRRSEPIESIDQILRQMLLCCSRDSALVAIDSALHHRLLSESGLRRILLTLPGEFSSVADEADAQSESGLETLPRIRFRRLGLRVESQVVIAGVGRVDLKIGDRLLIEADGRAWHEGEDRFDVDRSRDLAAASRGYTTLRPNSRHIIDEWPWFASIVLAMVERGEHLWSAQHRRDARCDGYGG